MVRALKNKTQRDYGRLDSGDAGLWGDGVEALAIFAFTRPRSRLHAGNSDDLTGRRRAHREKEALVHVPLLKDTSACRF